MQWQITAALAVIAAPVVAETPDSKSVRDARNAEVVLSKYPPRALAAGEQGPVFFKVQLDAKGHPKSCQVTKSSGFPRLDQETCDLILLHAEFKSSNGAVSVNGSSVHEGVINWKIPAGATVGRSTAQTGGKQLPDKKICKRTVRTGTLSGFERTCMTRREWEQARTENVDSWDELQGRKGSTNGQ